MELVKKSGEFSIYKKKNNRFCVQNKNKKYINGDEKQKVLLSEGLITVAKAKPVEEAPVEEAAAAEAPAEVVAEDTPAAE